MSEERIPSKEEIKAAQEYDDAVNSNTQLSVIIESKFSNITDEQLSVENWMLSAFRPVFSAVMTSISPLMFVLNFKNTSEKSEAISEYISMLARINTSISEIINAHINAVNFSVGGPTHNAAVIMEEQNNSNPDLSNEAFNDKVLYIKIGEDKKEFAVIKYILGKGETVVSAGDAIYNSISSKSLYQKEIINCIYSQMDIYTSNYLTLIYRLSEQIPNMVDENHKKTYGDNPVYGIAPNVDFGLISEIALIYQYVLVLNKHGSSKNLQMIIYPETFANAALSMLYSDYDDYDKAMFRFGRIINNAITSFDNLKELNEIVDELICTSENIERT